MEYSLLAIALLILRLGLGINLMMHGIAKLKGGVGFVKSMLEAVHLPGALAYGAYIGEFVAPVMLILGVFTQLAAFIILGNCLVILICGFSRTLFKVTPYGGFEAEIVYLYIAIALSLLIVGGGDYVLVGGCLNGF